jgi:DNA-binding NarL/FixJ family response regulator
MPMGDKIKVFIVDDHQLIIEGMRSSLSNEADIEVVGEAMNAAKALEFLSRHKVDVVLLDINLPDSNGIDLCKEIIKIQSHARILGLSTFNQRTYISRLMEYGARGYILKNTDIEEIKDAIRQVYKGNVFLSKEAGDALYKPKTNAEDDYPPLTRRELEILKLITEGLSAPETAEKLSLSQLTVESHRRNIMAKLKVKNVALLVNVAISKGLV